MLPGYRGELIFSGDQVVSEGPQGPLLKRVFSLLHEHKGKSIVALFLQEKLVCLELFFMSDH